MTDDRHLIHEKLEQATAILDEFDVDVWLTFVRETMLIADPALELIYDGDVTWQSAFLIGRDGRRTAIIGHFDAENVRTLGVYTNIVDYHEGIAQHLLQALADYAPHSIAVNYSEDDVAADGLTHGMYRLLTSYLADTPWDGKLVSAASIIAALRGRKTPAEIERVRRAVETTERLFDEIESFVRPGMTQKQIADFVHERIDGMGLDYAWPKPFNPIVTCGPESAMGHAAPGDVVLQRGHTFHVDLAVHKNNANPVYYMQYAHARICSVLAAWGGDASELGETDLSPLDSTAAQTLMLALAKYPEMLTAAAQDNAPHDVTFYLRDLAATYHSYYDAERILVDEEAVKRARLALIAATAQVLHNGLAVLGVSAPNRM